MTEWVIFDMDNTLINTEPLYIDAQNKFAKFMKTKFGFDTDIVLKRQSEIDASLLGKMGYSTDRFAESFELTVRELCKSDSQPWTATFLQETIQIVRQIAMDVFNEKSIEYEYAASIVRACVAAGYKVAVITAGERWVQIKRFDDLTMRNLFHDCWVVLRKDVQVFVDFCAKHNVDIQNSWMIGDSLASDILPAIHAGLNAIHLQTSNWQARDGKLSVPPGVASVKDLSHIMSIIGSRR